MQNTGRQQLILLSSNGSPMKSATLLTKMHDPGIKPSWGRPRVSNDDPYSESLFRTLKYCPQWPSVMNQPFLHNTQLTKWKKQSKYHPRSKAEMAMYRYIQLTSPKPEPEKSQCPSR